MAALRGLAALVTGGGASIGLATAKALARDGASVLLTGLDGDQLAAAADEVRAVADTGAVVEWTPADATDDGAAARAVARAEQLPGRLAICVHSVGQTTMAPILGYTVDEWQRSLALNVYSAHFALKHSARAMAQGGGGSFVAISSHASVRSMPYLGAYCATKAALDKLMTVAADELGELGVRVNVVRPGLTRREQSSPIFGSELEQAYIARTPLGRNGKPDDTAAAVRFLAGPESSWITGQCLTVDGGLAQRGAPDLEPAARRVRGDALFDAHPRGGRGTPPASAGIAGLAALVTGGGSSIGLASARALVAGGARVLIVGRDRAKLEAAAGAIGADWMVADVTDEAAIAAAVDRASAVNGRLDICVASAGTAAMGSILELDLDKLRVAFDLNVVGSYLTLKHACRAMTAGGSFIAISSDSAVMSVRNLSAYCASKAGLDMLVRVAADELGEHGIRVNSIRPGLTRREAQSPIFENESMLARYRERTPLVRMGVADDSAHAVRYLAGPESAWVTGQTFAVDGGLELRGAPDISAIGNRFHELIEEPHANR